MADHHDALEKGARLGYAARGVVYLIVGVFAFLAATGGGSTTDTQGALRTLVQQPFGQILLGLVALGLLGYALWRFVLAWNDPKNEGDDAKGGAKRLGYVVSGLANLFLAYFAFTILFPGVAPGGSSGGGGSGGGGGASDWTAKAMSVPLGQWLVGLVGLILIGVAVRFLMRAFTEDFKKELTDQGRRPMVVQICRFGIAARGVVFALIGVFVIIAAWQQDPSEAKGLSGALSSLQSQPFGWILLSIVGLGLIAFAFYSFVESRYRRIPV